jgi:hypothetical protein
MPSRSICIGNVKMTPPSTREAPWIFPTLSQATEFSRIAFRMVWAVIPGDRRLYEAYPGGRCVAYTPEVRDKWAARKRRKLI